MNEKSRRNELLAKLAVTTALLVLVGLGQIEQADVLIAAVAGYWLREGERATLRATARYDGPSEQ